MRFMMLLPAPVGALEKSPPTKELVTAMGKFNEDMTKAGVLLAAEGSTRPPKGRVSGCPEASGL
jgi:hypothetical protein